MLLVFTVFSLVSEGAAGVKAATKMEILDIQDTIAASGAKWVAGETAVSEQDAAFLTGLSLEPIEGPPAPEASEKGLARTFDWRNSGGNFVTPPRSQGGCGSCWAFAMTGALESYMLRTRNTPGVDLDLSEQVFVSCSKAGSCKGGALYPAFLSDKGLPAEAAYPYAAVNGSCSAAAAGWQKDANKIAGWGIVAGGSSSRLKASLVKYGPLPTSMLVYEDFRHYKSGIYSRVSGKYLGGHAVLLVGYNDDEEYFMVKNSWGPDWGEDGYFRIAYSEMSSRVFFGGLYSLAYHAGGGNKSVEALDLRILEDAENLVK
ncbi:MAG: hypothetical protein COT18_00705 [Elusimicrobia bacterium CG08_land_8_20_14_0_20_59_10]|nr:MAG: hypothetical protein COT18_00705 [Elusimicrobia bacterium CG08_land_8_20_14_0_20_59_10]